MKLLKNKEITTSAKARNQRRQKRVDSTEQRKEERVTMKLELLQPWSTFVMKTQLPLSILEKMIRITDEIIESRPETYTPGAGQLENQFSIDFKILEEQKEVQGFFLDMYRNYIIQAYCQNDPFNKEEILNEEYSPRLSGMWINSQKDNEYFPSHHHANCDISSVMYLKIPEYLSSRKSYNSAEEDGAIAFSNNTSVDKTWGIPTLTIQPKVGDFLIFPASQTHFVYPFRTADGKGERRSVSFNVQFTSKWKAEGQTINWNKNLGTGGVVSQKLLVEELPIW